MALKVQKHVSLKMRNTLGLAAHAEYLVEVASNAEIQAALAWAQQRQQPITLLGGGSNSVFVGNRAGLVICLTSRGVSIDGDRVTAAAGEVWDDLVLCTVNAGLSGLENLTAIPGLVGAAPIQNIGAYGVELADRLERVDTIDLLTGQACSLSHADCQFGYRDSVFKRSEPARWLITGVTLRLSETFVPELAYSDLREWQADLDSPMAVRQAVAAIRRQKLPDPARQGNAGSFFKNPVIDREDRARLLHAYPDMPLREQHDGRWKLSAAWLIDRCGLKGHQMGGARVSDQHALVLINAGEATGEDVLALARVIQKRVKHQFGISLDIEPVLYLQA